MSASPVTLYTDHQANLYTFKNIFKSLLTGVFKNSDFTKGIIALQLLFQHLLIACKLIGSFPKVFQYEQVSNPQILSIAKWYQLIKVHLLKHYENILNKQYMNTQNIFLIDLFYTCHGAWGLNANYKEIGQR